MGAGRKQRLVFTDRLLATLVCLRLGLPHAALAELFEVDRSTVSAAIREVRPLLASRGFAIPDRPGLRIRTLEDLFAYAAAEGVEIRLPRILRETDPDHVLLYGTLAKCDRVGDGRTDFSQKHRRHGVSVQVMADPTGNLLRISPALPGRTHDLTAARTHRIIRICERQGVPVLADRACIGAGPWVTTPIRRLPNRYLTTTQRTINRALSAARAPVERSIARLKSWQIFRRARCSPNRMTVIAAAVLTLERQR